MQVNKKIIGISFGVYAVAFLLIWGSLSASWIRNVPTQLEKLSGNTYEYNDHGRIVYLTPTQRALDT